MTDVALARPSQPPATRHAVDPRPALLGLTREELRAAFAALGQPAYRADQVLRWIYLRGVVDPAAMRNIGREAQRTLEAHFRLPQLEVLAAPQSTDGTTKLLLGTQDGFRIESVIIPEARRRTVCVSSQAGCSLDCRFCATGRLGFGRNLHAEEITEQWVRAVHTLATAPLGATSVKAPAERGAPTDRPTHIVFMGMGEPLANLAAVVRAIAVLCDPLAGGLSPKRVTVSTAGLVPRMQTLGEQTRVRLAISLHATTDELRSELIPLNRRFPLAVLLDACRRYPVQARDRISFEYILLAGVNDEDAAATRLIGLLRGIPAKVNLIPMNEHPGAPYRCPSEARISAFAGRLAGGPFPVSVRRSRGDDIWAACGQLGTDGDTGGAGRAHAPPPAADVADAALPAR